MKNMNDLLDLVKKEVEIVRKESVEDNNKTITK